MTTYVLAGGCFWCLDAVYRKIKGVTEVVSGYTGGHTENPTYEDVCTEQTGHAESVQVTFDEKIVSPEVILGIYFISHHPTTLNRDSANVGTSYRSAMFYADDAEKKLFQEAIDKAQPLYDDPIVTSLEQRGTFWPAEDYHQDYFNKNPAAGYCSFIIEPKISKARKEYTKWFKENE